MHVWIVNYYTSPDCPNPRYIEFAKHFIAKGWDVTTFYADWNGEASKPLFERQAMDGVNYVKVKAPHYSGNGLTRMKSIWAFAWTIFRHVRDFKHPDVVLHNVHIPFDYPILWAAKKVKAKYVAEAWDLWPEGFVRFGLIKPNNPVMKIAYWLEKKTYYAADEIVITLPGGHDYMQQKGYLKGSGGKVDPEHIHYINNGVNLAEFENNVRNFPREDVDMNDNSIFKIVYLGSLRLANHVKTLIDAASLLQYDKRYRFFIYGDGIDRQYLEGYVTSNNITNIVFKEKSIPLEECAWVVRQATVNIMNYNNKAGRWGMSSGKMFQYLAAGRPIVCNIDNQYDDVITENKLGVSRTMNTPEQFMKAIREVTEQPRASYDAMCERVKKTAERFDYKKLAAEEIKVIESALKGYRLSK